MRAPLAHGRDVTPADARIALPGPLYLDPWLDHVAHGPDPHGVARRGELKSGGDETRVAPHLAEHRRPVHREVTGIPARGRTEADGADREAPQLKTHGLAPGCPPPGDRRGWGPAPRR